MLLDLDVVIEIDPAVLPVRVFIRRWRQRLLVRPAPVAFYVMSCRARAMHGPSIELIDQVPDRLFLLAQPESGPELRQDPSLHDLGL